MLEIEIDGKKLTVPQGSTIIEAAHSVGTYIPHFCYHNKLPIAANCRMCLVEVEKANKPLPACATPVTDGMKVYTHSDLARKAQAGVMEFLLINHPLDCPICDQGGECQLQDLAVGYGNSSSRYQEGKRVVVGKDLGPLISAEEMSRCIHCTRCVRFTEEIGGFQELGMAYRGEFSEILPFLGKTVESEISGNIIDVCPVGALTSKPFRYRARPWELSRRRSVSPHDGLGSNLIVHVKDNEVLRVLPLENEAINECWIADRDRFSYEGLTSAARLRYPMIKLDGKWTRIDWEVALRHVAQRLSAVSADAGNDAVGFLVSPQSTTEELYLAKKLAQTFGVNSIDYRLRRSDFSADAAKQGAEWLGSSILDLIEAQSLLVVGSTLRKEQPLLTARLRASAKKGAEFNVIHVADDDLLIKVNAKLILSPRELVNGFAQVLKAVLAIKGGETTVDLARVHVSAEARSIAESLSRAETASVVLGNVAQHHPAFSHLLSVAQEVARLTGARFGVLSEAANSVGAEFVGALPQGAGSNAFKMIEQPKKAYVLLNTEVEFESYNPQSAVAAMKQAETVIALTAFKGSGLLDYADVLLPIAAFFETAGSFINMEGKLQSFNNVVRPSSEARPAWKVLRVLGNLLNLHGFDFSSVDEVRAELLEGRDVASYLNNALSKLNVVANRSEGRGRIGEVPLYQVDAVCRHAASLQQTRDASEPAAFVHSALLQKLGILPDTTVVLKQGSGQARVRIVSDDGLPQDVVRIATAHPATLTLGGMFDAIEIIRE